MKTTILKRINEAQMKSNLPVYRTGDTLEVKNWVVEGGKKRLQAFEGLVIARRNRGLHSSVTVRKTASGVGVERVFQVHSPNVEAIKVLRHGVVRKAKLYYLRNRTGKAARVKERLPLKAVS